MANINFTSMLRTTAADGKLAETDQLYDPTQKKFQKDINADLLDRLSALTGVYRYKGTVSAVKFLPKSPENGWVYNVAEDGMNYAAVVSKGYKDVGGVIADTVISSYKYSDTSGDEYDILVVGTDSKGKELAVSWHQHASQVMIYSDNGTSGTKLGYANIEDIGFSSKDDFIEYFKHNSPDATSGRYTYQYSGTTIEFVTFGEVSVVEWDALGTSTETDLSDYYNKSEVDQKISDASANMTWL